MTEIRIDIRTIKGCKPCAVLYEKLKPLAEKEKIPISMSLDKNPTSAVYPVTCVIVEHDGMEMERHCISGYYDGIEKDLLEIR